MSVSALARDSTETQNEPDGEIITSPSCDTAVVEGDSWDFIRYSKAYGPTQNGIGGTTPNDNGVTKVSVEDYKKGYINWVRCYIKREGNAYIAVERESPNKKTCAEKIATPTPNDTPESETHHIVIFGGGQTKFEYTFTVSGEIEPTDTAGDAPIKDKYVSFNGGNGKYDDSITNNGQTAHGWVAGGGDAYYYTGELKSLENNGAKVYIDGVPLRKTR